MYLRVSCRQALLPRYYLASVSVAGGREGQGSCPAEQAACKQRLFFGAPEALLFTSEHQLESVDEWQSATNPASFWGRSCRITAFFGVIRCMELLLRKCLRYGHLQHCCACSVPDRTLENSVGAIESLLPATAPLCAINGSKGSHFSGFFLLTLRPLGGCTRLFGVLRRIVTWLILPVVICLSQRLSHACLSISNYTVKLRMAH